MSRQDVLALPRASREKLYKAIVRHQLEQKMWDIKIATLSHSPMSKEAATSLGKEIRSTVREIEKALDTLSGKKRRPSKDEPIVSTVSITLEPGDSMKSDLMTGVTNAKVTHARP